MFADVTIILCPSCEGQGERLYMGGPGRFSHTSEAFEPEEVLMACSRCEGAGELEVCSVCREPLEISEGREVCGCDALEMRQAA